MTKLNIEPIKLLSGSHADTAQTGSGCFMNVIAYLNGEPQITAQSPCVCATIRPIAIWLNDYMRDDERHLLIPFIHRAMGTATNDLDVLVARARHAVILANECAQYAKFGAIKYAAQYAEYAQSAQSAAESAAKYAATSAKYAAKYAKYTAKYAAQYAQSAATSATSAATSAEYAATSAKYAATSAKYAARKRVIDAGLRYLDDVCPKENTPTQVLIERANKLVELANATS